MKHRGVSSRPGILSAHPVRLKDFEREYRDKGAYHFRLRGFSRWWMHDQYRMLARALGDGRMILDLACGDGRLRGFRKGGHLIGLDHSQTGLRLARERVGMPVAQAKMESLPLKSDAFDAAVCSLSLQYLQPDDLHRCLSDLGRILKKGGRLVLSYPNPKPESGLPADHVALRQGALRRILEETGFRVRKARGVCFRNPAWAVKWSRHALGKGPAFLAYLASRAGYFFPSRAYHYVLRCESTARPPQEMTS